MKVADSFFLSTLAISIAFSSPAKAHQKESKGPQVEVCFVLDTTGSMSGMIEGAKRKIWSIANQISASDPEPESIRFGLIGYRDRQDSYVTTKTPITDDLDEIHTQLMSFRAEGGGDHPESVNQALNEAITSMQWKEGHGIKRLVFLVGDAPPHMDYQDDVKYETTGKIANRKGITINTILCGNDQKTRTHWKKICASTQGSFAQILQDGGIQQIATPYDNQIDTLTIELNGTVVLYGDTSLRRKGAAKLSAVGSASSEAKAWRNKFQTNNYGGKVLSGNEDLVEQWKQKEQKLSEIDEQKLPENLRKLSKEELESTLNQKLEKRQTIQDQLKELNEKREQFLEDHKAQQPHHEKAFDQAIEKIIKSQLGAAA